MEQWYKVCSCRKGWNVSFSKSFLQIGYGSISELKKAVLVLVVTTSESNAVLYLLQEKGPGTLPLQPHCQVSQSLLE